MDYSIIYWGHQNWRHQTLQERQSSVYDTKNTEQRELWNLILLPVATELLVNLEI